MQKKLTLRIDDALIERAKRYAQDHNQSVSQIVANFFEMLASEARDVADEVEQDEKDVPGIVQELHGCLAGSKLDEGDYYEYLEERYS